MGAENPKILRIFNTCGDSRPSVDLRIIRFAFFAKNAKKLSFSGREKVSFSWFFTRKGHNFKTLLRGTKRAAAARSVYLADSANLKALFFASEKVSVLVSPGEPDLERGFCENRVLSVTPEKISRKKTRKVPRARWFLVVLRTENGLYVQSLSSFPHFISAEYQSARFLHVKGFLSSFVTF